MDYITSYRKYRPSTFDDVVGQEHIIKTLENSICENRLAHAYLFNGPRGTGKTSIAKIFARKINCECNDNTCITCSLLSEQSHPDIIEMDAASNNSVEEIRKLIDSINFVPIELNYKIYIIDEVHMLSKSAFNALLKTLEEPPKHAKFILATTEIHKIPLTIISRCQRFDFQKISDQVIEERLKYIVENENINYEPEALNKIAVLSDGGLRDALSLLDKVIMYEKNISLTNVESSLGIVNNELKKQLLDYIYNHETLKVVNLWDEISASGVDQMKFIVDFQLYIRDVLHDVISLKNMSYNQNILIEFCKQLNDLENRLMFTKNFKILIEVYFLDLATEKEVKSDVVNYKPKNQDLNIKRVEKLEEEKDSKQNTDNSVNYENYDSVQVDESNVYEEVNEVETITIIDILCKATKEDKQLYASCKHNYMVELNEKKEKGLAKFFEKAILRAASVDGYVFSVDEMLVKSYQKRIKELNSYLTQKTGKSKQVNILSINEWDEKRPLYVSQVKQIKENKYNIYEKAQDFFGSDIVVKK